MEIYVEKFGGASVNSAQAVRNVSHILSLQQKKRVVIISAMGKTTNKLENIVNTWFNEKRFYKEQYDELVAYHCEIIDSLLEEGKAAECKAKVGSIFTELQSKIQTIASADYDFLYDGIVSFGEKISTTIVSFYLNSIGMKNTLVSATELIRTDNTYRDANVDWDETQRCTETMLLPLLETTDLIITQGFIGGTKELLPVTLGREGSDYSAAIIAHCLKAESMTIWKDVPGLLNADPKRVKDTVKLSCVPYSEAIELSYYGASIIHPKTIKPLENSDIPLYIKSFLNPEEEGSVICKASRIKPVVPNYIFKDNQILLSVSARNFSFIAEDNLSVIFAILAKHKVRVNMMQNSAISFSLCIDENRNILPALLKDLKSDFKVRYNTSLQLITIRNYTQKEVSEIKKGRNILIEQYSRKTAQFLVSTK